MIGVGDEARFGVEGLGLWDQVALPYASEGSHEGALVTLRVQVPHNHILTQNLY